MNEKTKTTACVVVALLVVLAVWITRPSLSGDDQSDMRGELLFPDFTKAQDGASLEIVKYNEATGDVRPFKVAQTKGVWSIPSHENYPADAKEHLAQAATSLMGLKVLGTASDKPGDHATYGVIDPMDKDLAPGTAGVGMRVTLRDQAGKALADLVIGKPDPDNAELRYVRRAGQAPVYTITLATDQLSTDFGDWIEKDLLKLNPWDVSQVFIQDYSIDEARRVQVQRGRMTLGYDDSAEKKWKLLADQQLSKEDRWEDIKLAPDEELNTAKLDAMQSALDDLKIVDVARKPAGLSADLAADKSFFDNDEALASLMERGFYPAEVDRKMGIFSNEGEVRVLMKDGVEYILRFGAIAGSSAGSAKTDAEKKSAADKKSDDDKKADDEGVNRYLMVTAEFNPAPIPKPELEPLPSEEKPAAATQPQDAKPEAKPAEVEKPEDAKAEPAADKKPDAAAEKKSDTPADKKPDVDKKTEEQKKADLEKERKRIETDNKRKQDEYDEKIAQGKKTVAELNARFAGWYYVIAESVYDKIHLGRGDVVQRKKPEKKEDADKKPAAPNAMDAVGPDAFNELRKGPE